MTDTILGLLRACHAEPDCDLPRLLLVDPLIDAGQPERAELVRVQCEIERLAFERGQVSVALRRREAELLREWWKEWTPIMPAQRGDYSYYPVPLMRNLPVVYFRRGLLHVAAPLADLEAGLRRMGQEAWWVASVRATDKEPQDLRHSPVESVVAWYRREHDTTGWREWLPAYLFDQLGDYLHGQTQYYGDMKRYHTPDLAHADLSHTLLRLVREPGRVATTKGG